MAVSDKCSIKFNLRENKAQSLYCETFRGRRRAYWDKYKVSHYHLTLQNLCTFFAIKRNCIKLSHL
jgi:hypothetical protein